MLTASAAPGSRNRRSVAVCTGRGAAWSAHLLWEQGVAGSNPAVPTTSTNPLLSRGADGPHSANRSMLPVGRLILPGQRMAGGSLQGAITPGASAAWRLE